MTTTGKTKPLKAPTDRSNDDEEFTEQKDIKADSPTDSHLLSQLEQDEKGLAEKAGITQDVSDIGWGQSRDDFEERIVSGLSNQDLWMLIRRFNKVLYMRGDREGDILILHTANLLRQSPSRSSVTESGSRPFRR